MAELQALAVAAAGEVVDQVEKIVREMAANQPVPVQNFLTCYLQQVPATVRQTLRRDTDPSGTTIPAGLQLRKAEDVLPFLPTRLPRFQPGDRPLPGVDWELQELLGVGGFGEVWKATNPRFDGIAPVALKFCLDQDAQERLRDLQREGQVINQVMRHGRHQGIVQLKQTYLQANPPCLEYEYVTGGEMSKLIQRWHQSGSGPTAVQAAKEMLRLASIMAYAHRLPEPIVHRDLKPANILVQPLANDRHRFKVADFGIGQIASGHAVQNATALPTSRAEFMKTTVRGAYTPLYALPQQMVGEPADPSDDVFALGVIWYQLLTGDLGAGCPTGMRWQADLKQRGMTPFMLEVLVSCFEDKAIHRPRDAKELKDRLEQILTAGENRGASIARQDKLVVISEESSVPSWTTTQSVCNEPKTQTAPNMITLTEIEMVLQHGGNQARFTRQLGNSQYFAV